MSDDHIQYNEKGEATAFVGEDAVRLYQATALVSGIRLLTKGIKPTRGWTMTKALAMATHYTGKKYKRTQAEQAISDLKIWIAAMKAALPHEQSEY